MDTIAAAPDTAAADTPPPGIEWADIWAAADAELARRDRAARGPA